MASNYVIFLSMIIAITTTMLSASASAGISKETFQVAGKVLCQDCSNGWNEWVNGADPIKGGKVSVTCLDERSRVVHYASDLTDEAGNFEINCNKYVNGKKLNPKNCFVRLVSSADPVCSIATDFAGGKSGVKLQRAAVVYRDIVKYVVGPFYYTTPMCDDPDTTGGDQDGDDDDEPRNNY